MYYGPCGADILETTATDDQGQEFPRLHIVDLNVPTSGSLVLGLMKGHFSDQRGLHETSSVFLNVKVTRESFISRFEDYFREGKIVIV